MPNTYVQMYQKAYIWIKDTYNFEISVNKRFLAVQDYIQKLIIVFSHTSLHIYKKDAMSRR